MENISKRAPHAAALKQADTLNEERRKQSRRIEVAALQTNKSGEHVVSLIEQLILEHPTVDLVLAPEYTFYHHPKYFSTPERKEPLEFEEREGEYEVTKGDSDTRNHISRLQKLAAQTKTNICIGTVCEQVEVEGIQVWHNTALVIDNKGRVVHLRRKVVGSDAVLTEDYRYDFTQSFGWDKTETLLEEIDKPETLAQSITARAIRSALSTLHPITLTTQNDEEFSALLLICSERSKRQLLDYATATAGNPIDLTMLAVREGDDFFTERSQMAIFSDLQTSVLDSSESDGQALPIRRQWWEKNFIGKGWSLEDEISRLAHKGTLSTHGVWLASDGALNGSAGVFPNGDKDRIQTALFTSDFLIAECFI